MDHLAKTLVTLGLLFLLGLVADVLGRRTPLPRVTLLIVVGFLIGPAVLNLLPDRGTELFPLAADMALVIVGFLLGEKLKLSSLREYGRCVVWISLSDVVATALVMCLGMLLAGFPVEVALLFAGIAPATAPAAITDVVHELEADGMFSRTLLGIVAIDDAWGLIIFSLMLAAAQALQGQGGGLEVVLTGAWELGGAVVLGAVLGVPMALLTGRIKPGEPTLAEALGVVFLCGGIALWLEVSFLLASMVLGAVVANVARHHERPFHAIEGVEWPFMILFFILSGASVHAESLSKIGLVGAGYIGLRVLGRLIGVKAGTVLARATPVMRRWMWLSLMPQAGVALGMALVASQRFPGTGDTILTVVVAATVVFEVLGPVLTKRALVLAGEAHQGEARREEE